MPLIQFGPHCDDKPVRPFRHKIIAGSTPAERGRKGGLAGKNSPAKHASASNAAQIRWARVRSKANKASDIAPGAV